MSNLIEGLRKRAKCVYLATEKGIADDISSALLQAGGGKSPETREALLELMKAIERDNLAIPSKAPKD